MLDNASVPLTSTLTSLNPVIAPDGSVYAELDGSDFDSGGNDSVRAIATDSMRQLLAMANTARFLLVPAVFFAFLCLQPVPVQVATLLATFFLLVPPGRRTCNI